MLENQSTLEGVQSLHLASGSTRHWRYDRYRRVGDYLLFLFSQLQPRLRHRLRLTNWSDSEQETCRRTHLAMGGTIHKYYGDFPIALDNIYGRIVCSKGVGHFSHKSERHMTHETFELGRHHIWLFSSNSFTVTSSHFFLYKNN